MQKLLIGIGRCSCGQNKTPKPLHANYPFKLIHTVQPGILDAAMSNAERHTVLRKIPYIVAAGSGQYGYSADCGGVQR